MKAKMILPSSDRFQRLPYLADNLPSVVTDSKALNPNLFIDCNSYTLGPVDPYLSIPSAHAST